MRPPRYQSSDASESDTGANEPPHRKYRVQKSRLISLVNWYHVISVFFPYVLMGLIGLFLFQFTFSMYETRDQVEELARYTINAAAGHHITEGRWIRDRDCLRLP